MTTIGATAFGVIAVRNDLELFNDHKHRIYHHSLMILVIVIMVNYSQFNLMKRLVSYKTKRTVSNHGPQLHLLDTDW